MVEGCEWCCVVKDVCAVDCSGRDDGFGVLRIGEWECEEVAGEMEERGEKWSLSGLLGSLLQRKDRGPCLR